jgi:amino acid adenylation domain-containing protein
MSPSLAPRLRLEDPGESPGRVVCTVPFVPFVAADVAQPIARRFEAIVAAYGQRPALRTSEGYLTYDALNRLANRVARAILSIRPRGAEAVGLMFGHDWRAIAAMLGVLKAGKFYVILDRDAPDNRLRFIADECEPGLILTDDAHVDRAEALVQRRVPVLTMSEIDLALESTNLDVVTPHDAIAYVAYTSGSTGEPKGVCQLQCNVLHNVMKYTNGAHIHAQDRLALTASLGFSASVTDIFGALLNGACLLPFALAEHGLLALAEWLEGEGISIFHSVPGVFRELAAGLRAGEKLTTLRLIWLGGEAVFPSDVEAFRERTSDDCLLCVGLGASEVGIIRALVLDKQTSVFTPTVPVGYGVEDTEVLICDEAGNEVPAGHAGEIIIRSPYLFAGYYRRPRLTRKVLYADPRQSRVPRYRTGDLGRLLPDGCLVHLGRKDSQVKIRGQRVELLEVEAHLRRIYGVIEAAVVVRSDGMGESVLVGCVRLGPEAGSRWDPASCRRVLEQHLPEVMVPVRYLVMEELPKTATGKTDRRALEALVAVETRTASARSEGGKMSEFQAQIRRTWSEVLQCDVNGLEADFWALGGHSLAAMRVMVRLREQLGIELTPKVLFENPTLGRFSDAVEAGRKP